MIHVVYKTEKGLENFLSSFYLPSFVRRERGGSAAHPTLTLWSEGTETFLCEKEAHGIARQDTTTLAYQGTAAELPSELLAAPLLVSLYLFDEKNKPNFILKNELPISFPNSISF